MSPNTHSPAPEGLVYSLCAPTIPVHNFFAGLWCHLLIVHFHLCLVHKTVNPLREEIVFLIFVFTVPAIQNSFSGYLRASSRKLMRKKNTEHLQIQNTFSSFCYSFENEKENMRVCFLPLFRKLWGFLFLLLEIPQGGGSLCTCIHRMVLACAAQCWLRDVEPRKCWPPLSKDSIKTDLRKDKVPCLEESKILKACRNKAL